MQGLHLTADLIGCGADRAVMTDPAALRTACRSAATNAGLTVVGEQFHAFAVPGGVTGVLLLAESHLAVHTWPEFGSVTIDLFVCNVRADNRARAAAAMDALVLHFAPQQVQRHQLARGSVAVAAAAAR